MFFAQIAVDGKVVVEDVTINLVDGRLTKCFVEIIDAPAPEPDLLAAADERILELEYELILAKEGGMTIYDVLKRVIARGGYDAADLQSKMDVFLLYNRLTVEQYNEIMASMAIT